MSRMLITTYRDNYGFSEYILSGDHVRDWSETLQVNGYTIYKPAFFRNKAHARAFEIALFLARKKPSWSGVIMLATSECVDIIMDPVVSGIQLDPFVKNPRVPAHDAMKMVPNFFNQGLVTLKQRSKGRREWFLELRKN